MLDALSPALGPAGRVQRVADEDEPDGRGGLLGDQQGCDPSAKGLAADDAPSPAGVTEVSGDTDSRLSTVQGLSQ